jgi:hypothetical protein
MICDKFDQSVTEMVKRHFNKQMGLEVSNSLYRKFYVATYCSQKQVDELKQELQNGGIELLTLPNLLDNIRKLLDSLSYTVPEGLWLIKMIENMDVKRYSKQKQE